MGGDVHKIMWKNSSNYHLTIFDDVTTDLAGLHDPQRGPSTEVTSMRSGLKYIGEHLQILQCEYAGNASEDTNRDHRIIES